MRIPPAHRTETLILEDARLVERDGRLEAMRGKGRGRNLPLANLSVLLLGPGSSIEHAAARQLAKEGIAWGFSDGEDFPFLSRHDPTSDHVLPSKQAGAGGELGRWARILVDDEKRLKAAKALLELACEQVEKSWGVIDYGGAGLALPERELDDFLKRVERCTATPDLIDLYRRLTRQLITRAGQANGFQDVFGEMEAGLLALNPKNLMGEGREVLRSMALQILLAQGIPTEEPLLVSQRYKRSLPEDLAEVLMNAIIVPAAFAAAAKVREFVPEYQGAEARIFPQIYKRLFAEIKAPALLDGAVRQIIARAG